MMPGICRLIDYSGTVIYDFLNPSNMSVEDGTDGISFDKNIVNMRLFAKGGPRAKASTLENLLQASRDYAIDPMAANGMSLQIDGGDAGIVSALVVDFEMVRISPNILQTFDWAYYQLALVLLDDGRQWESPTDQTTVTKVSLLLGKHWDLTADLDDVGTLGARIRSLVVGGGSPINKLYAGIKPKRAGQTGGWASVIYGDDFNDNVSADTTTVGSGIGAYLSTDFSSSEAMVLRAQSAFTDWGVSDGSSAPHWRTQQGVYRIGYVYDHSDATTQAAVTIKLRVGNRIIYDSGVVYPTAGDTDTHLEFLPGEVNLGYTEYDYDFLTMDAAATPSIGAMYYAERLSGSGDLYMLRLYLIPAEHFICASFASISSDARVETTARHKTVAYQGNPSTGFESGYTIEEQHNWYYPRRGGWLCILPTVSGSYYYTVDVTVRNAHGLHNVA